MLDRGLRRRFDPLVERAAREAPSACRGAAARPARRCPTFTIDPPTARDFDDAISAERLEGGGVRVWVHIADVAAHVRPGSHVDREAFRRGTSVYVPGLVEPMLPEALSNQACSLVPDQDRLAVTVELELDGATVRRRLPPLDHPLGRAAGLSGGRRDLRRDGARRRRGRSRWPRPAGGRRARGARAQGALAVESSEPEFAFYREGHVTRHGERADRVPPPDRAPDDRRQRGGRHAARDAQAAGAVPRARAAGAGARRAAGRAARVARRPHAAAAGER